MTIHTLINCPHRPNGWCLDCVQKLDQQKEKYRKALIKCITYIMEDYPDLIEYDPVLKDGKVENFTIKFNGESFTCNKCGCNVFNKPNKTKLDLFECNGCKELYESEPKENL